jgi:uncharacterized cupin superfamily protein
MPKIDLTTLQRLTGSGYPAPFAEPCRKRLRRKLGDAGGLDDFGVNITTLPPGTWSSQRHWHSHEDEFVWVLAGELTLVEEGARTQLRAGDCAAFPKGVANGHHLINETDRDATYLEVGTRSPNDVTTYPDIDLQISSTDDKYVHKDGTPY